MSTAVWPHVRNALVAFALALGAATVYLLTQVRTAAGT